ncbi:IclR family transcriptional regulator, partial [Streptomyces sp. MCAF7]
ALGFSPPATVYGIRTLRDLRRDLTRVRERGGVAVDCQGCGAGITVVAAAVGPPGSEVRAALSLCGPTDTMPAQDAGEAVRVTAMDIWYAASGMPRRPRRPPQRFPSAQHHSAMASVLAHS